MYKLRTQSLPDDDYNESNSNHNPMVGSFQQSEGASACIDNSEQVETKESSNVDNGDDDDLDDFFSSLS